MDYLLCFLSFFFFSFYQAQCFHWIGNILLFKSGGRLWVVSEKCYRKDDHSNTKVFLLCILLRAAISPWEHIIPFALQLLQRRRPEHFTCFLVIDIIFFNVGLLLLANRFIICIMNLKLQNAAQRRLCWQGHPTRI